MKEKTRMVRAGRVLECTEGTRARGHAGNGARVKCLDPL